MPTLLDILTSPVTLTVIAAYGLLLLWETFYPGRELPPVRGWKRRGIGCFALFIVTSNYLPLIWDERLGAYQVFDLSGAGVLAGTLIGFVVYEFGVFLWHVMLHRSSTLWRGLHQLHHSAERLDTHGAFYLSPLDMIGWILVSSLCLIVVVGVTPQAATNVLLIARLLNLFQHTNVRTPRWVGYIIQRPESHTVHHGRGVHAYNYCDFPVIDMIFRTFRNPSGYDIKTGFYDGASARVVEMILFNDVSKPKAAPTGEANGKQRVRA